MKTYKKEKMITYIIEPFLDLLLMFYVSILPILFFISIRIFIPSWKNRADLNVYIILLIVTGILTFIEIFVFLRTARNGGLPTFKNSLIRTFNIYRIFKTAKIAYTKNSEYLYSLSVDLINKIVAQKGDYSYYDFEILSAITTNENIDEDTIKYLQKDIQEIKDINYKLSLNLLRNPGTPENHHTELIETILSNSRGHFYFYTKDKIFEICTKNNKYKNFSATTIFKLLDSCPWLYPVFKDNSNFNMEKYLEEFCDISEL